MEGVFFISLTAKDFAMFLGATDDVRISELSDSIAEKAFFASSSQRKPSALFKTDRVEKVMNGSMYLGATTLGIAMWGIPCFSESSFSSPPAEMETMVARLSN